MAAPVLDISTSFAMPSGETTMAGLVAGSSFEAIAVTGLDTSLGAWQYSLDAGANWLTVDAGAINSTTNELALLLGPTAMLRLTPFGNLSGSIEDAITFRAWDQSTGSEG
jgi:hypothetical protein